MKTLIYLCIAVLAVGCTNAPAPDAETVETPEIPATPDVPPSPPSETEEVQPSLADLAGYYVGDFEAEDYDASQNYTYQNRINISIEKIGEGQISGRSIVAGNDRPFTGTYTETSNGLEAEVVEPGDDRYDGKFSFIVALDGQSLKGDWVANDSSLPVSKRIYELTKEVFEYDPTLKLPESVSWADLYNGEHPEEFLEEFERVSEAVLLVNASVDELTAADVENLFQGDLEVIRNSIYARHGYSFRNRRMRYVFDRYVEWYIPVSTDVRAQLTEVEQKNIDLLKRYEEHADKYYDVYGR